jgi:hypothetical protein
MKTVLLAVLMVTFKAPDGWRKSEYSNAGGADQVVKFEKAADSISVRQYGGKDSFYKSPDDFLSGPAATSMGKTPDLLGQIKVAGKPVDVYKRQFPIAYEDTHAATSGAPRFGSETYCVLPASPDGRFTVLSWSRESPIPDLQNRGEKAWLKFLKTVQPVAPPKPKKP